MPGEVASTEAVLLDELASVIDTMKLTDVQTLKPLYKRKARHLSAFLVDLLQIKRIPYEAI